MQIPLSNSFQTATVDPGDANLILYRWSLVTRRQKQYACARVNGRRVYMHRLIMGNPAAKVVDHEDGNGLNNTRRNLRVCTRSQNMGNCKPHADRKGLYKGVCFEKASGRFVAQICLRGKRIKIGRFKSAADAALAYDHRAAEAFGTFAKLNFANSPLPYAATTNPR
jgi:hypothetical protein